MALNFTVSYTFSPSTTISSSQVNTNTSDVASVFQGLEAVTKSLARLQVDAAPTVAADVARKDYVDHYSTYRRPVLQYSSATVVNMETGLTGTSGQAAILFPDGTIRTDSTTGRINCNFAQVAALSGTAQSGLRTGAVAVNTYYAIYAVKVTDSSTNFVAVADTVLPLQANYATLNSNFGTSGWVYLGTVRNGDNSGSTTGILNFAQSGNLTRFTNACVTAEGNAGIGTRLTSSAGTAALTYSYSAGTGAANIPAHFVMSLYSFHALLGANAIAVTDSGPAVHYIHGVAAAGNAFEGEQWLISAAGMRLTLGAAVACDINLGGFIDSVLGVGSNPLL